MKSATAYSIVLVTAPSPTVARQLARAALEQRLVACANLVPRIESLYWWRNAIQSEQEVLLILKTRKRLLAGLETLIGKLHPYDTPEFLALPVDAGSRRYLEWLHAETA